ncbi:hypothetical protein [Bacteroides xylanisolvens]|uniref:hypothetical protein n=1 Tax=Bacteroides xylanisolvens TaxID=371601 RepID=UPI0035677E18
MKTYLLKPMVVVCLCLLTASFTFAADNYKMVKVKAAQSETLGDCVKILIFAS